MDKKLAFRIEMPMLSAVVESDTPIPYERLMAARPALLWALEREWTDEQARSKGYELEANENSAWLVLEGEAMVSHDGKKHRAGPGYWMFPKPGRRVQSFAGPFRFLSVTLQWQWPGGMHLFSEGLTRTLPGEEIPWLETEARDICSRVAGITPDPFYHIGLHSMTLRQAAQLFELAARWAGLYHKTMDHLGVAPDTGINRDPRIESVLRALQSECGSPQPDRDRLAGSAGVSPRQLDRLLKKATGKTLMENHDSFRHENACRGLLEQGKRVKEVAMETGFQDLPSFSRWFAKRAGCSPRTFRERFADKH